ncbi:MAG TPA: hypothetical protein VLT86_03935 [Vicinamibacterales bacterium]|nr:hypothetical protein [Vicinamibacterales bacterium]
MAGAVRFGAALPDPIVLQLNRPPLTQTDRVRLTGDVEQRGSRAGFSTPVAFVFGLAFVGAGTGITLIGARAIEVRASSIHAPLWVLIALGVTQASAGLLVWGMAWRQFAADRRRIAAASAHPEEPALADYPWDPSGFDVPRWHGVARFVGGAAFFTTFISVFNYWAFATESPVMVKLVTSLFDLVTLVVWWQAAIHVGRALKFQGTRITYDRFPYRRSMPVVIHWQPAAGIRGAHRGSFTLRCVEEAYEQSGSGNNRQRALVHDQLWAQVLGFDAAHEFDPGEDVALSYTLPADAQPTSFAGSTPRFWELEVKLDRPGLDFVETYLVPVY